MAPYCFHLFLLLLPVISEQFGEWLKLWLIHFNAAREYIGGNDAPEHPNNPNHIHYCQSDREKSLCMFDCCNSFKMCTNTCDSLNTFFFLSVSLHPRPNSKLANALWIIRQIYWQRADYRNEWCMMQFCSIVHVSIYLLASRQRVWRHSIAYPLASDRVLVIWYRGYSKRASLHRA